MGRKKKTDDPLFKPLESTGSVSDMVEIIVGFITERPHSAPPPLANYGADEKPRQCIHCASKNTRVNRTRTAGRITMRCRSCQKCGKLFSTREIAP